jgi:hypothetical protein
MNTELMNKWFGDNSSYSSELSSKLEILELTWIKHTYTFSCGGDECSSNMIAYVNPTDAEHNVYLCE